jgi:PAS domain S-box-containing protein
MEQAVNSSDSSLMSDEAVSDASPSIKVLIIEDESLFALDILERLRQMGYTPCGHAVSLETGLVLARQRKPDLVLMDINLGDGGDGVGAAKVFADEFGIPVIFLTAYSDRATVERASAIHPFGFVLKPVGDCQLDIAIRFALERAKMEAQLRSNERKLRVTLQSIGDAVIATDAEGRIVFLNPAAEILFEVTEGDAIGRFFDEFIRLEGVDAEEPYEPQVRRLLRTRTPDPLEHVLSRWVRSDGTTVYLNEKASLIFGVNQQIEGAVVVCRDVSKERARRESSEKAARLRSLGALSAGIAHDFNNITTSILGNLELALVEACAIPGELGEHLDRACKACLRAKSVTQQLLTFAAGGEPVRVAVDIRTVIKDTVEYVVGDSPIKLEMRIAEDLSPVMADTAQMSQVIHNVAMNAVQALAGKGILRVSAFNQVQDVGSESAVRDRDVVVIRIEDDGPGIPDDLLPRIFDPFVSTKEAGRGLGLASAFSMVERHGGTLRVKSVLGKGTTVDVVLPALMAAVPPKVEKALEGKGIAASVSGAKSKSRRVLVVDDEEGVCFVTSTMLKAHHCEVEFALNGEDALDRVLSAQASGQPFALAILDLTLPGGLGGHEILLELRKVQPELAAIVCSGYSDDPVFSDPEAYGFNGGLRKPFTRTELFAAVDLIFGQAEGTP